MSLEALYLKHDDDHMLLVLLLIHIYLLLSLTLFFLQLPLSRRVADTTRVQK